MAEKEFDSILDWRSSNSTLIFQFCDLASTRLRLQSFNIRLDNELRVGTPLRQYFVDSLSFPILIKGLIPHEWAETSDEANCFLYKYFES